MWWIPDGYGGEYRGRVLIRSYYIFNVYITRAIPLHDSRQIYDLTKFRHTPQQQEYDKSGVKAEGRRTQASPPHRYLSREQMSLLKDIDRSGETSISVYTDDSANDFFLSPLERK